MTLKEAARILGLSANTLGEQARRGRLRTEKYGPIRWVSPEEVERYRREVQGQTGKYDRRAR